MKHLFLDTDVIIDFLHNREPFSIQAARLFEMSAKGKIKIYLAAASFNNVYYILRRSIGHKAVMNLLQDLSEMVTILDVTGEVIIDSIKSGYNDFEDAIQYHTAISNKKIEAIVTRNVKDFKKSSLSIFTPEEALKLIHLTTD